MLPSSHPQNERRHPGGRCRIAHFGIRSPRYSRLIPVQCCGSLRPRRKHGHSLSPEKRSLETGTAVGQSQFSYQSLGRQEQCQLRQRQKEKETHVGGRERAIARAQRLRWKKIKAEK